MVVGSAVVVVVVVGSIVVVVVVGSAVVVVVVVGQWYRDWETTTKIGRAHV